ncbi:MAG TPA: dienelactone hydrolase family protein [Geminicoccaceae bacterium]|nr:dienelactone hydrolase family protein [Geminicoccaceae bacterium]
MRVVRRAVLARGARLGGAVAVAVALWPLARAAPAAAALVAPDDPRLAIQTVTFPAASGELGGYVARPAAAGSNPLPAVIVVHENRGLNGHIEDLVRRVALAGFMGLAPDLLAPLGGTPDDPDQARELVAKLDTDPVLADLVATLIYLRGRPDCSGAIGALGFGWGGGAVNRLATVAPSLDAAVSFYGRTPSADATARIKTPLLLHYGALDEKGNEPLPEFETALKAARVDYVLHMYPGANQSFHNDTVRARYNAQAAALAWDRTVQFFKRTLG